MTADTLGVWQGLGTSCQTTVKVSGVTRDEPLCQTADDPELEWLLWQSSPGRNTWAVLAVVLFLIPAAVALAVVIAAT